ncbi:MAG: rhomboid family intramembrane serine protease, partial [Gammaproteobacteria bacterium]|nr:rhomboid family intramembrane serine protease [Gammaproteobacteria bacterium]
MPNNDNVTPFRRPTPKKEPNNPQGPKHEPILNIPPVCNYLMIALLAIHLIRLLLPDDIGREILFNTAFIPARYDDFESFWSWPAFISPITHMFIHGGWAHLLINVAMLLA